MRYLTRSRLAAPTRLLLAAVMLGLAALALLPAAALAASPEWAISVKNENPYGEAGKVDPFNGSATTFNRESGFNSYIIKVTNTGSVATGTPNVGEALECTTGKWATDATYGAPSAFSYQWLRNGTPIAEATDSTYRLAPADEGTVIQCEVTAETAEGSAVAFSPAVAASPVPATAPPAVETKPLKPPKLSGTAAVGDTLSCAPGTWSGSPSFTYRWLRDGTPIFGAAGSTYALGKADLDSVIQCEVTATNAGGTAAAVTEPSASAVVLPVLPESTARPTVSGTPAAGETLTCNSGSWTGASSFEYQWLRDGSLIPGATSTTYALQTADESQAVQCRVTAESAVIAISASVLVAPTPATAPPTAPASVQAFLGQAEAKVGDNVKCSHGSWGNLPSSYLYQWLRGGAAIAGANSGYTSAFSFEYVFASSDVNHAVQCEVLATNAGGTVAAVSNRFVVGPDVPILKHSTFANNGPEAQLPVTVADTLPEGIVLDSRAPIAHLGWNCDTSDPQSFTCSRAETLAPGASYPAVIAHVHVQGDARLGTPPEGGVTDSATVSGGGASPGTATASDPTTIAPAVPFGIFSFTTSVEDSEANPFTQAGGHPFGATTAIVFNSTTAGSQNGAITQTAGGDPKAIEVQLPPGFIGDPQAAPHCPQSAITSEAGEDEAPLCKPETIVGFIDLALGEGTVAHGPTYQRLPEPIYNVQPPPGHPAEFAFIFEHIPFALFGSVRSDGDYGLTVGTGAAGKSPVLQAMKATFCDAGVSRKERTFFTLKIFEGYICTPPSEVAEGAIPLLSNPTACTGPAPATTLRVDSYENPAEYATMTSYSGAASASPAAAGGPESTAIPIASSFLTGCNALTFKPEVEFAPGSAEEGGSTQAGEPTGENFKLKVPQPEEVEGNVTPALKDATVTLPPGLTVDPSAAGGLQACSDEQFGLGSTVEPAPPAKCPLASQAGTVEVVTPLLEKPLTGQAFIGQPECAPCSSADAEDGKLFRLFLQLYSPERGVVVKLAGKVHANPTTGQLQASFENQPQLPFSELVLKLKGGPRAPLANPETCGSIAAETLLTPWSVGGLGGLTGTETIAGTEAPKEATKAPAVNVSFDGKGGACPATLPFGPTFSAGSHSTAAGASAPFSLTIGRGDREQDLSAVSITMPPGLIGKVAEAERCAEAQANAGTCPAGSQIGTVTVGAGAGPHPYYLHGEAYLTGPYKGAPFGLSIAVPTKAGPFTLAGNTGRGVEVVRAAISVNPHTAQVTVVSDPVPQVLEGVPLRLRTIHVEVDRPGFMVNPTSCAQQQLSGTITSAGGAAQAVSSPFDVGGCAGLPFKPSFAALIHAHHTRKDGEYLHVVIGSGAGQANLARVHVSLPVALPSRDETLKQACTEAQFAANPAGCPAGSFVGTATVHTPILAQPLTGPAIFVSHGGRAFPNLDLVLQGEGVTIVNEGETFIGKGVTTSTFAAIPDVPVSRISLVLPAGPHSALAGEGNLCYRTIGKHKRIKVRRRGHPVRRHGHVLHRRVKVRHRVRRRLVMPTVITGQNGAQITQKTPIAVEGCRGKGKAHAAGHRKHHKHRHRHKHRGGHHRAHRHHTKKRSGR